MNSKHENILGIIANETGGRGVDVVYECSGAQQAISQSVEAARVGGSLVWIGIPSEDTITINPHAARRKELVIRCDRRAKHAYEKCIEAVADGRINVKDMATHHFKLKDIVKAFEMVENYKDGVIKAIIRL